MIKNLNLSLLSITLISQNKKYNYFKNVADIENLYKDFY